MCIYTQLDIEKLQQKYGTKDFKIDTPLLPLIELAGLEAALGESVGEW